jgi:hypothetical protein
MAAISALASRVTSWALYQPETSDSPCASRIGPSWLAWRGNLRPRLGAAEAGFLHLGEALLERDEVAQPLHAVIGPADGIDPELHGHMEIL